MSSLTSQPSMNAVVAALEGQERDTGLILMDLQKLTDYWADVRPVYVDFESDLKTPCHRYLSLRDSWRSVYQPEASGGEPEPGAPFREVKDMYKKVNDMLGDIVKVTPSSKMVGDLAIFMVQNDLTPENIVEKGVALAIPTPLLATSRA